MKKFIIFILSVAMGLTSQAQRCAVMQFNVGQTFSQEETEAINYIFNRDFTPTGYKVIERPLINATLSQLGYSRTGLTLNQYLRVGRELTTTIIVVGEIRLFMGEYTLDARVVDVATGVTIASKGLPFEKTSYRNVVSEVAKSLSATVSGGTNSPPSSSARTSTQSTTEQEYVDLGLPSGTLWKKTNEKGGFYDYDSAVSKFGDKLPSKEQWEELKGMCTWTWTGKGYKVTGDNGNSIVLPAAGYRNCGGNVNYVGSWGYFWSSSPDGSELAWDLGFGSDRVYMSSISRCCGQSVRLVQD